MILTFNNLRNGNGEIEVNGERIPFPHEYEIRISSFMYGIAEDDVIEATIKNSSIPTEGQQITANSSYASYSIPE